MEPNPRYALRPLRFFAPSAFPDGVIRMTMRDLALEALEQGLIDYVCHDMDEILATLQDAEVQRAPDRVRSIDLTGKTVVMVDPMSDLTASLAEAFTAGEPINELLHNGDIRIDNTPMDTRAAPQGVSVHAAKWR